MYLYTSQLYTATLLEEFDEMNTCIQNTIVPNKKKNFDSEILSLRLNSVESVRFWKIMDAAKARNPYAGRSDIIRELLGLQEPQALTKKEITFFRNSNTNKGKTPLVEIGKKEKKRKTG